MLPERSSVGCYATQSIYKLISSQAKSKDLEGSETRRDSSLAENAQRLEKLQKRLEEIKIGVAKAPKVLTPQRGVRIYLRSLLSSYSIVGSLSYPRNDLPLNLNLL